VRFAVGGATLVSVLFAGDLRAQEAPLPPFNEISLALTIAWFCASDNSDETGKDIEVATQSFLSGAKLGAWNPSPSCNKATASGPRGVKSSFRESGSVSPRIASSTFPGYVWILSGVVPDTAPATDDAVYVLDPNTSETVATILTPGPIPQAIAPGNTGQYVYATIQGVPAGENGIPAHPPLIEVMSTSSFTITQTINLPDEVTPGKLATSPDDRYLYVPVTFYNQAAASTQGELLIVDTENPSSITTVPLTITTRSGQLGAAGAANTAITPDGELLMVLCSPGICVIDTTTQQQTAYIGYGAGLETLSDLAIDPTGSRLYVAGQTYVYAYDTATLMQIGSALTKASVQLNNIGISTDGSIVLVSDANSGTVFSLNPVSLAVTEIDLPALPPFPSGLQPTFIMTVLP
jgi:DNA-binding beta-propeller fold protein YncE